MTAPRDSSDVPDPTRRPPDDQLRYSRTAGQLIDQLTQASLDLGVELRDLDVTVGVRMSGHYWRLIPDEYTGTVHIDAVPMRTASNGIAYPPDCTDS